MSEAERQKDTRNTAHREKEDKRRTNGGDEGQGERVSDSRETR